MKPKNPTNRRVRKDAVAVDRQSGTERQRVIIDFIQRRIETYNQELGGGVSVRKDRSGYTLIREDMGIPLARLRPIGENGGSFEVLYWSRGSERWRPIGEWGITMHSLEEALDFIASDPMDCFWT
jgi:hypothetical protein